MKIHMVSLGCAKNLVDSEIMLGRLIQAGGVYAPDPAEANTIVINTCSFIESATEESIDTILEMARYKRTAVCRRLIVAGCLPERFREKIVEALPEVDIFLGTGAFHDIVAAVKDPSELSGCRLPDPDLTPFEDQKPPRLLSSPFMAYLKIAEGCSRHCTYCIIPRLRGRQKSRPPKDIVAEARMLISKNVKELILVAQDTTAYGSDLNPPAALDRLLADIAELSPDIRVRFLYGHPESMAADIIRTVAAYPNICSYFDIPIQHASPAILKKMGRNYSPEDLRRLCGDIRSAVPDAALRTTVITGFPGETDQDFEALFSLVEEIRFDHLGVFTYSDSEDLPSHGLPQHVPAGTATDRHNRLMARQSEISWENNRKHIGKVYQVLVEADTGDNYFTGRTFFQAPEVDGLTYIQSRRLSAGTFVNVRIKDAYEYDLTGEAV